MGESSDGRHPIEVLAEDFLERHRRGESPAVSEYARRHAALADEIRDVFPALLVMEGVRPEGDLLQATEAPVRLGDFRIVREIGRGGMGVVYEAEQTSLRRRVALKVLPRAVVLDAARQRRFRNEALAAAQLEHPHIVEVYGTGNDDGQHFYVMRYIEGRTLAELIEALRLKHPDAMTRPPRSTQRNAAEDTAGRRDSRDPASGHDETASPPPLLPEDTPLSGAGDFRFAARVGLQVADALEHAHQQGVVHRDIKPSNLIIDRGGSVHICDFGLAQIGADATLTATGDVLGTLRYMSPEQALGQRRLVDHRTDIYSLGVTLYELITLQPAHPGEQRNELLRFLATQEPIPPRRLNRRVPADLETIVLKAISREPAQRYASAGDLTLDLQRFLDGRPICARRPSLADRASKWLRRHRGLSLASVLALLAAMAGLVLHTASLRTEQTKTRKALDREAALRALADGQAALARQGERAAQVARDDAEAARRDAERAAKESEAVVHFLTVELLEQAAPARALGRELTVRDVLNGAERLVGQAYADAPVVEAAVRHTLGKLRFKLGDYGPAAQHLERAAELREALLGPEHRETISTLVLLQAVYFGQYRLDEGERLARRVYAVLKRTHGDEHPETLKVAQGIATYLARRGQLDEALEQYRRILKAQKGSAGEQSGSLSVLFSMASTFEEQGDWARASQLFQEILSVQEPVLGEMHPDTLKTRAAVANLLRQRGSIAEALRDFEAVLEDQRRVLGDEHPETLDSRQEIALLLEASGRRDDALRLSEQVLEAKRRVLGPEHPSTLATTANLGSLLSGMRRYDEARQHLETALAAQQRVLGPEHQHTLKVTLLLAAVFRAQGDSQRALELHREARDGFRNELGPDHHLTLAARSNVANCLFDFQRFDEARSELQAAVSGFARTRGPDHPQTLLVMFNLALACERSGHVAEACRLLEDVFNSKLRKLGHRNPDTLMVFQRLLWLLDASGQTQRAAEIRDQVLQLSRSAEEPVEAPVPVPKS